MNAKTINETLAKVLDGRRVRRANQSLLANPKRPGSTGCMGCGKTISANTAKGLCFACFLKGETE